MTRLLLALPLCLLTTTAIAQERVPAASEGREVYRTITELGEDAFEPANVDGTVVGPGGELVPVYTPPAHAPMISLRDSFAPEMQRSLAEVR